MVGLACISKCVVCEKERRIGNLDGGSVDEKEEGGRKRRIRNLASTSINLHLLVRALPCLRPAFHHHHGEGALPPTSELSIIDA